MQKRIPNLDGLRFIAALLVLLSHVEGVKKIFGIGQFNYKFLHTSGQTAVTFFFVLSGFLISSYLLTEKKENENISPVRFYKKRIARIWPLYYLLLLLNFFIFPSLELFDYSLQSANPILNHFNEKLAGCFFFIPNSTQYFWGSLAYMDITWSLAVEECFYLFFPLLIYYLPLRKIKKAFFILFFFFLLISLLPAALQILSDGSKSLPGIMPVYIDKYRLYALLGGAIASWYFVFPEQFPLSLQFLKTKNAATAFLILFFILVLGGFTFSIFNHQFYTGFFALMLFSLSTAGIRPFIINNSILNYCGNISYGIYMLHPVITIFVMHTILNIGWYPASAPARLFIDLAVAGLTVIISAISYHWFEKKFIRLARKPPAD